MLALPVSSNSLLATSLIWLLCGTSGCLRPSSCKKDENRCTLTDFKIIGLEMPELGWTRGVLPTAIKAEEKEVAATNAEFSHDPIKQESTEGDTSVGGNTTELAPKGNNAYVQSAESVTAKVKTETSNAAQTAPPSRIRIYFHTPASVDDSHPIPHNYSSTLRVAPMDSHKGKRKKLEDDDGDTRGGQASVSELGPGCRAKRWASCAYFDLCASQRWDQGAGLNDGL
ncbi:hypothetical protein BKA83DRAFT_651956, partial [Pisolithus microcarpus]